MATEAMADDRRSPSGFLDEVERERVRLQREIESARARVRRATASPQGQVDAQAEFRALFLAARTELEKMEREHRQGLEAIRTTAAADAAQLLTAAGAEALAIRAATATATRDVLGRIPDPIVWPTRTNGEQRHGR